MDVQRRIERLLLMSKAVRTFGSSGTVSRRSASTVGTSQTSGVRSAAIGWSRLLRPSIVGD
jgi:hypothetical protein